MKIQDVANSKLSLIAKFYAFLAEIFKVKVDNLQIVLLRTYMKKCIFWRIIFADRFCVCRQNWPSNYLLLKFNWKFYVIVAFYKYWHYLEVYFIQGEYTGGQSPYFIPYKDNICFIWLDVNCQLCCDSLPRMLELVRVSK